MASTSKLRPVAAMLSGTASGYNRRFSRETFRLNLANVAEGTADDSGARVRTRLAAQGRRLPILGNSDASPQPRVHQGEYIKQMVWIMTSCTCEGHRRTGRWNTPTDRNGQRPFTTWVRRIPSQIHSSPNMRFRSRDRSTAEGWFPGSFALVEILGSARADGEA